MVAEVTRLSRELDSARDAQKPPMPIGLIIESKPPARTLSTAPRRISFSAVPTACPPDAHAVCTELDTPRMPTVCQVSRRCT